MVKKKRKRKKPVNPETKTYKLWELRKLKNRALKLWALRVKERAGFKCEICHGAECDEDEKFNSHHIEHFNTSPSLRYDVRNGLCARAGCHKFRRFSAHRSFFAVYECLKDRPEDLEYLLQNYKKKVDVLEKSVKEMTLEDIEIAKKWFEEKIKELENER